MKLHCATEVVLLGKLGENEVVRKRVKNIPVIIRLRTLFTIHY
jgi:hypothetical protein